MTCCLLHNLLSFCSKDTQKPGGFDGEISKDGNIRNRDWKNENVEPCIQPLHSSASRHAFVESDKIRALVEDCFMGREQIQ